MNPENKDHPDDEELPLVEEDEADDEDEEGDGKGDSAALALDVPEPAQAMAADAGLAKDGIKGKGLKGKGGKAGKAKAGDKSALHVAIDDEMFGREDESEDEPDEEAEAQQEVSAYDSDEITDPDVDDIDPLMMILGGQEKPWENEKLSVIERMMLDPGYERDLDALNRDREGDDPKAKDPKGKDKGRGMKGAAVAAGVVALAAGVAIQAQAKGPGVAGVSRGPQRAAEQEQPQVRPEAKKPESVRNEAKSEPITVQARRNAEEVTLRRIATGLAATVGMKAAEPAFDRPKTVEDRQGMDMQDLIEMQQQLDQNDGPGGNEIGWIPSQGPENRFDQTMDMIYASLGMQTLMNVSPYRQAGWDEKRLEQKENSQDVTIAPQGPEQKAPAPDLTYQRNPQINLGPGGM